MTRIDKFPKVVDSLYIRKNVDLYITGSNAYMLSSEIATLISGRYVQIEMLPLSFKEYSFFDSGNKPSKAVQPERFYHGFVLGLVADLAGRYYVRANRESGFGWVLSPFKLQLK